MKETLRSKVFPLVEQYVEPGGVIRPGRTREVMSRIHTDSVRDSMARAAPNRVLNQRPPKINQNEKTLPTALRPLCKIEGFPIQDWEGGG